MKKQSIEDYTYVDKTIEINPSKISRVEVITLEHGRELVKYGEFRILIQDDGRTIKIIQDKKKEFLL